MKRLFLFIYIFFSATLFAHDWYERASGTAKDLLSVSVVTDSIAWVCGKEGTVLLTTDEGHTWAQRGGGSVLGTYDLLNIFAVDAATAFVTATPYDSAAQTTKTYVFRTSDGGQNWSQVFSQDSGFVNGIYMFDNLKGVLYGNPVGGRWSVWLTSDGGSTWDSTGVFLPASSSSERSWPNAFVGYTATKMFMFGTNNSRIYFTNDHGKTWKAKATPIQNTYIVWTLYGRTMAGGEDLISSMDFGDTWTPVQAPGSGKILGIGAHDNWNWWIIRDGADVKNIVLHTPNFGVGAWDTAFVSQDTKAFNFMSTGRDDRYWIWIVKQGGGLIVGEHHHGEDTTTAVNEKFDPLRKTYSLEQNYPNPFNPTTTIRYSLEKESPVTLKIYNSLGQQVRVLAEGFKQAGGYEATFDASGLSSGIYFYSLQAGDFRQVRRMMLVK